MPAQPHDLENLFRKEKRGKKAEACALICLDTGAIKKKRRSPRPKASAAPRPAHPPAGKGKKKIHIRLCGEGERFCKSNRG